MKKNKKQNQSNQNLEVNPSRSDKDEVNLDKQRISKNPKERKDQIRK
ncbi:MAG: hypothetical protein AB7I27_18145 [Bacteriovoracaceae bacterium]